MSAASVFLSVLFLLTNLCFRVAAEPVKSHPRLLISAEQLPDLRARMTPSNPVWTSFKVNVADKALADWQANKVPELDTGQHTGNGNPHVSEMYAMVFAFMSLLETNEPMHSTWVEAATNCLMAVIEPASLGHPQPDAEGKYPPFRHPGFALNDRSFAAEAFPLAVDWIYPHLTADQKAKIRKTFILWARDCNGHIYFAPQNPDNLLNDPALLQLNDPQRAQIRLALNNHYANHMRQIGMYAMSFDPADDLPNAAIGDNDSPGALTGYITGATPDDWIYQNTGFLLNATGVWLYLTDYALRHDGGGGVSQEGTQYYSNGLGPLALFMLALHTAGQDDPAQWGPQVRLANHPFWDKVASAYLAITPPAPRLRKTSETYRAPFYEPVQFGDSENWYMNDQHIKFLAPLGLFDLSHYGTQTARANLVRWMQRNLGPGGTAKVSDRIYSTYTEQRFRDAIYYFLLMDPAAPAPVDPRPLEPKTFFGGFTTNGSIGYIASRTGWTTNDTFFDYRIGWQRIDHQHADANSFELWRNGVWVTKRWSGYGSYEPARSDYANTLTLQNNLALLAGTGSYAYHDSLHGSGFVYGHESDGFIAARSFGQSFLHVTGDATGHYNKNNDPAVKEITHASRSLVWVKPDFVVVYDRAKSKQAGYFKRFWLSLPSVPQINGNVASALASEEWDITDWAGGQPVTTYYSEPKANLFVTTLLPLGASISGDTNKPVGPSGGVVAAGEVMKARLLVEAPGNPAETRFLHLLQVADAVPSVQPVAASHVASSSGTPFEGAVFGDTAVLFPVNLEAPFTSLVYSVPAATATHYITGLAKNAAYDASLQTANGVTTVTVTPDGSTALTDSGGVLVLGANGLPTVSIAATDPLAGEAGPDSATLTISRSGSLASPLTVNFMATGTASAGDYTLAASAVIPANAGSVDVSLTPVNDSDYEGAETVTVTLQPDPAFYLDEGASAASVTIADDDAPPGGYVQLASASFTATEGGIVSVIVQRIGGATGPVSVGVSLNAGTAGAGDLVPSTQLASWASGETSDKTVNFSLLEDASYEGDETALIGLGNVSGQAALGVPTQATVTIADNDPPPPGQIAFVQAAYTVSEDAGQLQITVARANGSGGAVTAGLSFTVGSATPGVDFSFTPTQLAWADGEMGAKTVTVSIAPDTAFEGASENFGLALSIVNGAATLGALATTTVTITDDDPEPQDYHIGDAPHPYPSIGSIPWKNLGPGAKVYLHWRPQAYHEKILISSRGTAEEPIQLIGVAGPNGERPVIDGENATSAASLGYEPYSYVPEKSVVAVARPANALATFKPGYVEISGLEIRNTIDKNYTDSAGQVQAYWSSGGGIYLRGAEHVTIRDCEIHHAFSGIIAESGSSEELVNRDILIERCWFHDNAKSTAWAGWNVALEGVGMTVQFCRLDPNANRDKTANLRDRSAGSVVRYNWVEGGAYLLELVEASGAPAIIPADPNYHTTFVYGNVLINRSSDGSSLIRYGVAPGYSQNIKNGPHHFYHNTVVVDATRSQTTLFSLGWSAVSAQANNNIFHHTGSQALHLLNSSGTVNLGKNWIRSGWFAGWSGTVNGAANCVAGSDPGFVNFAANDLHLTANSPAHNAGGPLAPDLPASGAVTAQYKYHANGEPRPADPAGADLGAFEFAVPPTVTTLAATSLSGTGATLNGTVNPNGQSANAYFEWGLTPSYGTASAPVDLGAGSSDIGIQAALTGLAPHQTYHFRAVAAGGGVTVPGSDQSFNTLNTAPVAGADVIQTGLNTLATIPASQLLANDTDADGDSLTVSSVSSTSAQGGNVLLSNGLVIYQPPANFTGQDSFTYTAADGFGGTGIGSVAVTVKIIPPPMPALVSVGPVVNGSRLLTFLGTPEMSYTLEASNALSVWETVGTTNADANGLLQIEDANAGTNAARFYRLK